MREIFAALIEARGGSVEELSSIERLLSRTQAQVAASDGAAGVLPYRIVTEPYFAKRLAPELLADGLVVGDLEDLSGIQTPVLLRPLEEEKIERALEVLINR